MTFTILVLPFAVMALLSVGVLFYALAVDYMDY